MMIFKSLNLRNIANPVICNPLQHLYLISKKSRNFQKAKNRSTYPMLQTKATIKTFPISCIRSTTEAKQLGQGVQFDQSWTSIYRNELSISKIWLEEPNFQKIFPLTFCANFLLYLPLLVPSRLFKYILISQCDIFRTLHPGYISICQFIQPVVK